MFVRISQVAERAAMSVSRRAFFGRLGQLAVGTAALVSGMLASTAQAQVVSCGTNADCGSPQLYCAKGLGNCSGTGRCARRCLWSKPILAPVCGCNGVTFGNACQASYFGVNVAYLGACRGRSK